MRGTPFLHENFSGGINTVSDPYQLADNETRGCLNVVSTQRGSIRKRYGSVQFIEAAAIPNVELDSIFPCNISGTRYLLCAGAGKVYSVTMAGAVKTIGEGFTSGKPWSFIQAPKSKEETGQGPVYMCNGTDKNQYWSGVEAKTLVAEWKGVKNAPEVADGVLQKGSVYVKSKTIGFKSGDMGLTISFKSKEPKVNGSEVKTARILAVISSEEVKVEINEVGWEAEYTTVKISIERAFYETAPYVPQGKYMIFAGNRVWMTGISADPSAVWFSELVSIGKGGAEGDPSSWPTTNVVRFDAQDENPITGIGTVGPYIVVFKEEKTWVIHDLNTGANRRLADTIGCVSHRSIVHTAAGTYFLTRDQGVYLTEGSKLHEMSYNVKPTIQKINPAQREKAAGVYWNNHYYLSYAKESSATNNRTLDYDTQLKSWWEHDLSGPGWCIQEPSAGKETLFLLPSGTKKGAAEAFVEGKYTDLGSNYVGNEVLGAYWLSPWTPFFMFIFRHRLKAPFVKKRVRGIFFNGEGQIIPSVFKNFQVGERQEAGVSGSEEIATGAKLPVEFGTATEKWGEGSGVWGGEVAGTEVIWGGETAIGSARIYSPGVANVWSIGWGNNSAEGFTVDSYTLFAQFRKA